MRLRHCLAFTLFTACGSSHTSMPDAFVAKDVGFNQPTAALKANTEVSNNNWMELGPADLTCLNTASTDQATTVAVALATTDEDFQSGNAVPAAKVTAFKTIDYMSPFDTKTADANGMLTVNIPVGTKRFGFQMTGDSVMPTFLLNQIVDPMMATQTLGHIQSVSNATAATLPALIGETRNPGSGVIAGAMRDCKKHEMSNFVATVSTTSAMAMPLPGSEAYYFSASVGLPVHHNQQESASGNGLFMVIQLPAAPTAYVQIWGYSSDAEVGGPMKLIAEMQAPVLADTVITGSFEPLRM